MGFTLSDEQVACIDGFKRGESMIWKAYAGAAKTSTSVEAAKTADSQDKLIYLAFNRSIADEAGTKFPRNTMCKTFHGLAFGALGKEYAHRLKSQRMTARQTAEILGVTSGEEFPSKLGEDIWLSPFVITRTAKDTVTKFCQSDDDHIGAQHVPYVKNIDHNALAATVLPIANAIWQDAQNKYGVLKFEHDYYFKMWALTHPRINADAGFMDEAQDANPCRAGVFERQDHMQKIMVGDTFQQIYAWTGAVDAMQSFKAEATYMLTQSFRFGLAIAEEGGKWLTLLDAEKPLRGFNQIDSKVETLGDNADAILCRTNAMVISRAMAAQEADKKVHLVGKDTANEIIRFAEGAADLISGKRTSHPDLAGFKNWQDVEQYVDEEGTDLKVMVDLVNGYGTERIIEVANSTVSNEKYADIVLSTAHKSKGREWDKVTIADDFTEPEPTPENPDPEPSRAESMLAYVAVTRAQRVLDNSGLTWVDRWLDRKLADEQHPTNDELDNYLQETT